MSDSNAEPMIVVRNLVKEFGRFRAVDQLSFEVERGQIYGFIGPNGAGKTTTMRILVTLEQATSGYAYIDGVSVADYPEVIRRIIGWMPDEFGVYEGVQVREYLEFFAACFKIPVDKRQSIIDGVVELTELGDLLKKDAEDLSKGMKQRLCLARTLIHDPKLLILDEPASGLDPRARIEFRLLLKTLRDMGKTVFLSSHILTELSDVCDSVCIIEQGKLVAQGSVQELANKLAPTPTYVVRVMRDADKALALVQEVDKVSDARSRDNTLRFAFDGTDDDFQQVVKKLMDGGIPLMGFEREKINLEDIFMTTTQGRVQ
jgi:ABC-2 type transport system ATP-binding protein